MARRSLRLLMDSVLLAALALPASPAAAQTPPTLTMSSQPIFEGNSGTRAMIFVLTLSFPSSQRIVAEFSTFFLADESVPNQGSGGSSCGDGLIDYISVTNLSVVFPPGVLQRVVSVDVCGDTVFEPDEFVAAQLTNVTNARCPSTSPTCLTFGNIRNDDPLPGITINNVTVKEPIIGTTGATFTVSLTNLSQQNVTVDFATRDGTAQGSSSSRDCLDYVSRSGTLTVPAHQTSGTIGVSVCAGGRGERDETFFVDLSRPLNATVPAGTAGQGTIVDNASSVGTFSLAAASTTVAAGERAVYTLTWVVPEGRVWRDLSHLEVRVLPEDAPEAEPLIWVRWSEVGDTFRLCTAAPDDSLPSVRCGPGETPGSSSVLQGRGASLHLADTRVEGSGPTGQSVRLVLNLSFAAAGRLRFEAAAEDDLGNRDEFQEALPS